MFTAVVIAITGEEVLYAYGPLGVFAVAAAIAIRMMFTYIIKDRDDLKVQRDQLVADMFTKALPLLQKVTEVLEKRQQIDQELIEGFRDAKRLAGQVEEVMKDVRRQLGRMP